MPVESLLISGPRRGGKNIVARMIGDRVLDRPAHYLRMVPARDGYTNAVLAYDGRNADAIGDFWASRHQVSYTPDRLFETVPDGLRTVRSIERTAFVVIEADDDPALRHAYPYDYRVFVMTSPSDVYDVFRTSEDASEALQEVMQDTAAFASEIFGLFEDDDLEDSLGVHHFPPSADNLRGPRVERLHIAEAQIRHFLNSPLGAEIASRIQLQPAYHALVEADVVLVNSPQGEPRDIVDECVNRLQKLLSRIRQDARRQSVLYWGDVTDETDRTHRQLVRRLRALLAGDA